MSDQPKPIPNDQPAIVDLVIDDIRAREALGLANYGTRLQAFNGRDAIRDAYEEALDLAFYLKQAHIEMRAVIAENSRLQVNATRYRKHTNKTVTAEIARLTEQLTRARSWMRAEGASEETLELGVRESSNGGLVKK